MSACVQTKKWKGESEENLTVIVVKGESWKMRKRDEKEISYIIVDLG